MQTNKFGLPMNTNQQLDAYKREQASAAKVESFKALRRSGLVVLFKGDSPRVFANMTQAEKAAQRNGGEAYKDFQSARFMVRATA